jgi:hypothetical protein
MEQTAQTNMPKAKEKEKEKQNPNQSNAPRLICRQAVWQRRLMANP